MNCHRDRKWVIYGHPKSEVLTLLVLTEVHNGRWLDIPRRRWS